jgi:GT2 family glycosyltransferase
MQRVTVVIASRNRAAGLRRTVARLRALPERPPVIVVDNGSVEGSPRLLRDAFPDVRVVPLRRNHGAVARNVGVSAADTPYVAFADDDSWWADGALARAADLLDSYPRLAVIAGHALVGTAERPDPVSEFMATAPLGRADDLPGPTVLGFLAFATVVRREAYLSAGGFDPVVFFRGEEERLAYDLAAAGWGLAYCADVVAHHHPESSRDTLSAELLAARNAALTAWMRRPLPVALARTAPLVRAAARGPAGRTALAQFAARLPRALRARRAPDPAVEEALARLEPSRARPDHPASPRHRVAG